MRSARGRERPGIRGSIVRVGAFAAIPLVVFVLAGCVPEGDAAPSSSPSSSPTPADPSATPSEVPTSPAPTDEPSATATVPAAAGEVLIITAADMGGTLEVTAMIPGISESDGTCSLVMPDLGLSTSVEGTAGNGVTYCGVMSIAATGDPSSWSFRVDYSSSAGDVSSDLSTLESTR